MSLHRHVNGIHCLFLSVLFCSSVSVASWDRQVWKIMSTSLSDPCHPTATATVETWLNNMGVFLHQYLSPHMACFDYAAPNSPCCDKTQRYNDSDTRLRTNHCHDVFVLSQNSQSLGFAKWPWYMSPKIQSSLLPPCCISTFLRGLLCLHG